MRDRPGGRLAVSWPAAVNQAKVLVRLVKQDQAVSPGVDHESRLQITPRLLGMLGRERPGGDDENDETGTARVINPVADADLFAG